MRVLAYACLLTCAAAWIWGQRSPSAAGIQFRNATEASGLHFVLENSPTERKHIIETMPGGLAVFDYNGDGRPDIYFTNGAAIPSLEKDSPRYYNRLYRNDGNLRFTDVTAQANVAGQGYSMGVAAADYDNDGHPDLFIAGVNQNTLYHNRGDGAFEDVTAKSALKAKDVWSVAAGWFDYDNDGRLDLLVVHYSDWSVSFDRFCGDSEKNVRVYCHPKYFEPAPLTLYHNLGNGRFADVSESSGIARYAGRGMSVAFADYDHDGWQDAFVTNDNMPNFLLHNKGNGTFEEVALAAGVALPDHGKAVASMGTDFRDYDNDGWPDISVTALAGETFPMFRNLRNGTFTDATYASRIASLSTRHSGWGNGLIDFNNDGWKDFFTANSHVNDRVELFEPHPYKEPNSVFVNSGNGKFADASEQSGEAFRHAKANRGAAFADFNGDGLVDVVVSALGEPADIWQNVTPDAGNWIAFQLTGNKSNWDAIGTRIRVGKQWNEMTSAVGYASSSLTPVHFGLGAAAVATDVEIRWPSGVVQRLQQLKANRVVTLKEPAP